MNSEKGKIWFGLGLDNDSLKADVEKSKNIISGIGSKVTQESNQISNVLSGLQRNILAVFTINEARKLISDIVSVRGEFQQLSVAFETMLGNKAKADKLMSEVVDFAAKTPFNLKGVAGGTKQLLAYGIEAENIIPTLKSLGDVSAGLSVPIERLILNYGQIKTQTKLTGRDLRDFNTAGVPLIAELAKNLNKTETEIQEMVSAGKIGFKDVENAFRTMTGEGGRFANLMDKQSKTITGQISNIEDSIDQMFNKIGQSSEGVINGALSGVSYLVEHYKEIGKVLAGLVATYGSYKTAIIAYNAVQRIATQMAIQQTLANTTLTTSQKLGAVATLKWQKATSFLNKTMLSNPYVLVATAVVGLATAIWALKDSESASEKAIKSHNEAKEKQIELEKEHKEKIDELINTVNNQALADAEREGALISLKKEYPKIFEKYDIEKLKLVDILKLKKEIAEVDNLKARNKNISTYKDLQDDLIKLRNDGSKYIDGSVDNSFYKASTYKEVREKFGRFWRDKKDKVELWLKNRIRLAKEEIKSDSVSQWQSEISKLTDKVDEKRVKDEIRKRERLIYKIKQQTKETGKEPKGRLKIGDEDFTFSRSDLEEQVSSLRNQLSKINEVRYNYIDLEKKYTLELKKLKKERRSIEINDKKLREEDLRQKLKDKDEEIKEAEQRLSSVIGKNNKKTSKKSKKEFDAVKNTREEAKLLRNAELEKEEARISIMKEGAEKRQALIQLDFDRREETINQHFEDEKQKLIELAKERAKAEGKSFNPDSIDLSSIEKKKDVLLKANAENYDRETNKHFKELLDKYKTFEEQKAKIAKQYDEEINALERQNQDGKYNAKIELAKAFKQKELTELEISAGQTKSVIGSIFTDLNKKSVEELDKMVASGEDAFKRLEDAFKDSEDPEMIQMLDTIRKKLEEIRNKADKIRSPFQKLAKDFKKLFDKNSTKSEQIQVFSGIQEGVNNALAGVNMLSDAFRSISEISGDETFGGIAEGLSNVADLTNKTMQGFQAGMALGGPVGGAIGGAIGLVTGVINKIGESNKRHREAILRIQQSEISQQRELNKLLFEENMLMKDKESIFGVKEISRAIGYLAIYRDEFEKLQDSLKKKDRTINLGFGFKRDFKASDLDQIAIKTGHEKTGLFGWGKGRDVYSSITQIPEYKELYSEQDGFNRKLAESILQTREFGEGGKEALQKIIDQYDHAQEAQKQFDEYLKSTFGELGGGFVDSVVNSLKTGEDAFESFSKSVGNVIGKLGKQLVEELFISKEFDKFKERLDAESEKGLSSEELGKRWATMTAEFGNSMKGKLEQAETFLKTFSENTKDLGYDVIGKNAPQAKVKGFQAMSQDVGSDLNGKFTLMVELKRKHLDVSLDISTNIKMLQQNSAQSLKHLSNIDNHTSRLSNIENGISGLNSKIEDIQLKGIKIK